ncbi:hypothetical protein F7725_004815, partial [Dissostichus mawsoni]
MAAVFASFSSTQRSFSCFSVLFSFSKAAISLSFSNTQHCFCCWSSWFNAAISASTFLCDLWSVPYFMFRSSLLTRKTLCSISWAFTFTLISSLTSISSLLFISISTA